ncbi:MAG: hypothetical protein JSW25_08700 [Thermoplasmata archaeon]|nr:MAG: hypothetical protein JSW25_08700 [Thermoplasmata archaeon]
MSSLSSQQPPPGGQPTPYAGVPGTTGDQTPISTYMLGGLIICAITGILLLVDDFGGAYWYDAYNGIRVWLYIGAFTTWYGFLILMPLSLGMFYLAYWSSQAMRDPGTITISMLNQFFRFSLFVGGFITFLGILWAGYSIAVEYDEWWLDTAFFAGMIGGFLAAFIFYQAKKQAEQLGYPQDAAQPQATYPPSGPQPPVQ